METNIVPVVYMTLDGQVYKGKTEDAIGSHCYKNNFYILGICVQDSYMKESIPINQRKAFIELCKYLYKKYKIEIIKGHKELTQTDCPKTKFHLNEKKNQ